jgi:hypothetical protein
MTVTSQVGGKTRRYRTPFSFKSLRAIAGIREQDEEVLSEAYDQGVWPVRRRGVRNAEVRYHLHTRNAVIDALLKKLSRKFPRLTFALASYCLDDCSYDVYTIRNGRGKHRELSQAHYQRLWDQARRAAGVTEEDDYDEDAMEAQVETRMRNEAVSLATGNARTYSWRPPHSYNKLSELGEDEIEEMMREVMAQGEERPRRRG